MRISLEWLLVMVDARHNFLSVSTVDPYRIGQLTVWKSLWCYGNKSRGFPIS